MLLTRMIPNVEADWRDAQAGKEFKFPAYLYDDNGNEIIEDFEEYCRYSVVNYEMELKFWHTLEWPVFVRRRYVACVAWLLAHS